VIDNDHHGAPVATFHWEGAVHHPSLSISHSHGHAFCALCRGPNIPLGADIERIAPREPRFVEHFFTPQEIELVERTPPPLRDGIITAIWSAKEAALKALRIGFTRKPQVANCALAPPVELPPSWTAFRIEWDPAALPDAPPLCGWWQVQEGFVFTLAARQQSQAGQRSHVACRQVDR